MGINFLNIIVMKNKVYHLNYFVVCFLAVPRGLWDLSSLMRDKESRPPAVEVQSPNHWTTREFHPNCF